MTLETSTFIFHFGRDEYSNLYRISGVLSLTLLSNIYFVPSFPKLCGPVWNFLVWATCQATIKLFLWMKGSEGDILKSFFKQGKHHLFDLDGLYLLSTSNQSERNVPWKQWCNYVKCYDTVRHIVIQYDTRRYNAIKYNAIQYDVKWYNTIQSDKIQYNVIQCDTMQYNAILCNTIWCDTIQ